MPISYLMWPEIQRKLFHLTALLYVVGAVAIPRETYLFILGGLLAVEIFFELARLRVASFQGFIERHFGGLLRTEERYQLSGIFWMLLGVMVTMSLLQSIPLATAALLYLVLGDTAASLIGMRVQGPAWPGSKKTLSGSAACFLFCFFIGMIILQPIHGWGAVFVGALVATIVESGVFRVNDNFTIPVVSALVFRQFYSVPL